MPDKSKGRGPFLLVLSLTIARLPLAVVFGVLLHALEPGPLRMWIGLGILVLIELTDLLDGLLARRLNTVTEMGATLDPYADSVARLIIFWSLALAGLTLWIVPLVMAVRDVTVAYSRITMARHGRSVAARWSGKVKAVVQGLCAFLLVAGPLYEGWTGIWPRQALSWTVAVVTAASAVEYVRGALEAARSSERAI